MSRTARTAFLLAAGLAGAASAQLAAGATKFLGNITTSGGLRSDFFEYWNQLTPENETKWASIETTPGERDWSTVKAYYDSCQAHGALFKFHTFVWGSQAPSFMTSSSYTDSAKHQFIEDWIADAATQFPDLQLIDVVNEPDHTRPTWYTALGDTTDHEWVVEAFRLARKYFPKATLILNDYNNLRWSVNDFITIAKQVKAAGYLDAIGCQAHDLGENSAYNVATMDSAALRKNLKKLYDSLQVPIYITELDLSYEDDSTQLAAYQTLFPVMWESEYVASVTLWGYVYGTTWSQAPYSGLIQDDGTERPAMVWLREYLADHLDVPVPEGAVTRLVADPVRTSSSPTGPRLELVNENGRLGLRAVNPGHPSIDLNGRF